MLLTKNSHLVKNPSLIVLIIVVDRGGYRHDVESVRSHSCLLLLLSILMNNGLISIHLIWGVSLNLLTITAFRHELLLLSRELDLRVGLCTHILFAAFAII